ncbi:MAG: hypothetical protein H6509_06110 [Bryobacterales bacterium]|nr:hypothetical protein [Bryobacterales bacterium]
MQFDELEGQLIQQLAQESPALARLAENEDALARILEAYQARDARTVRAILDKLSLSRFCVPICRWLCVWECIRVCRVICRELPEKPFEAPALQVFAAGLGRLGADEKAARQLFAAIEKEDSDAYHKIIEKFELQAFCHLVCYWICFLRCRPFCRLVCPPLEVPADLDPFDEFLTVAQAAGKIATKDGELQALVEAYEAQDAAKVQAVLDRFDLRKLCIIVCRWLCVIHCFRVCILICPKLPRLFKPVEIRELALRWRKLAANESALDRLIAAYREQDEKTFHAILGEFGLERFCFFLCRWICHIHCGFYCRIICPPSLDCRLDEPVGCTPEEVSQDLKALVVPVRGTASGGDFDHYTLEWSDDNVAFHSDSFHYPPIPPGGGVQGSSPVVSGLLAYFDTTALSAGPYFLRLTVFSKAGATKICTTSFSLFKQDVRILAASGYTNLDKPALDPTARFVETFTPKCTSIGSTVEVSFARCVSFQGSAFVGGCNDKKIKRYTLSHQAGAITDCSVPGWTEFWKVEYATPWQYRDMNMRTDTDTLTAVWVDDCVVPWPFPPYCLNNQPEARLSPSCWQTQISGCQMSGLFTVKLEVEDVDGNRYCDLQRIWLDNKPIHAALRIDAVPPCTDLRLSQFALPPDCSNPWPLPLVGIAYDEYIDETLPLNQRPNDNFDHYWIRIARQGGPEVQIPINGPAGSCFYGTQRVGVPGARCQGAPGADVFGKLADFDLRAVDRNCFGSTSYAGSIPADFPLERGECCVFTFRMRVYDTTKFSGGPHVAEAIWPVKICNDL